jgi:hypothetical protein
MSDLLDLAMNAHGGLGRWREIKTLDLRMSLTGNLFRIKGYRGRVLGCANWNRMKRAVMSGVAFW